MSPLEKNAALILIGMQQGYDDPCWGERNHPNLERRLESLLWVWRWTHRPIFHVWQRAGNSDSPFHRSRSGHRPQPGLAPLKHEIVVKKRGKSAFIGTDLKSQLWNKRINRVVFAGLTIEADISSSARMAHDFGFQPIVLSDGTAAFALEQPAGRSYSADAIHQHELAILEGHFASVVDVETIYARALDHEPRERASLVIVCENRILLMHRRKRGREYYVIPGGGVERGESAHDAAVREAKEETGLDVNIERQLWTYAEKNHFFLVTDFCGDLTIQGPERQRSSPNNRYQLEWLPLERLPSVSLSPAPVADRIVAAVGARG